jgi:limonene 1,2-monooxygenase
MSFRPARMQFGVFMPPLHHQVAENPTLSLSQDLEFIEHLDRLGFDEAWIGEHHSGATEIYGSPEIMIAAAAERTKHIKLGTGVVDLPLQHPFHVADRMVMLDHLTRGRAMLGVGSGARHADFTMLGYDPANKARMSGEALAAIMALLRAEEPVTMKTDWFELLQARVQLASYTKPHLPVAVAGSASDDAIPAAGRYGLWQLSGTRSFESVREIWSRVEHGAGIYGTRADRANWRLMKFVHLAESRQEALNDCREGFKRFRGLMLLNLTPDSDPETRPEESVARGGAIIGTPDDLIEYLDCLLTESGGYGGFLGATLGLADRDKTMRSYELWARWVAPRFQGQYQTMQENFDWVVATGGGPGGSPF